MVTGVREGHRKKDCQVGEKASGEDTEGDATQAHGRSRRARSVQVPILQSSRHASRPDQSTLDQWGAARSCIHPPCSELPRRHSCWTECCRRGSCCWNWGKPFHILSACHHTQHHGHSRSCCRCWDNSCRVTFDVLQPVLDAVHFR